MKSLQFLVHRVTFAKFLPEIAAAFSFAPTQLFLRMMLRFASSSFLRNANTGDSVRVLRMIGYFAKLFGEIASFSTFSFAPVDLFLIYTFGLEA